MYTKEIAELLGEVYTQMLKVMNKKGHDPYWLSADTYPMKCFVMLYPRAAVLGIPADLDEKITKLMNLISMEDMEKMMETPMPAEFTLDFEKGKMKR